MKKKNKASISEVLLYLGAVGRAIKNAPRDKQLMLITTISDIAKLAYDTDKPSKYEVERLRGAIEYADGIKYKKVDGNGEAIFSMVKVMNAFTNTSDTLLEINITNPNAPIGERAEYRYCTSETAIEALIGEGGMCIEKYVRQMKGALI